MRYEGQVKQRQQRELADTIIGKIQKELENPKTLQQILQQSVADVESKWLVDFLARLKLTIAYRNRLIEGAIVYIPSPNCSFL